MVHYPGYLEVIVSIDESRLAIASLFGRTGLEEPRRRLLESHIRMLERLSEQSGGDPAIGLLPFWSDWTWHPMTPRAQSSAPRSRDSRPIGGTASSGESGALDCQRCPSVSVRPDPTGESEGRLDPHAHAHAVIRVLESRCEALGVDPACFPSRPSRWPALPPIGARSNERQAAWTTPAISPHVSPPSRRHWYEEIPTTRCSNWCCARLHAGRKKRLASRGLHRDRRHAAKGIGRSLYRVTSRPPKLYSAAEVAILRDKLVGLVSERPSSR